MIKVIYHGELKKFNNSLPDKVVEYKNGILLADIISSSDIPADEIAFGAINGSRARDDETLSDGDVVTIFQKVIGG